MAAERRAQTGFLAAWSVSLIVAAIPFCGVQLDPVEINPFKGSEPDDPALAKAREFLAKRAWVAATKAAGGK